MPRVGKNPAKEELFDNYELRRCVKIVMKYLNFKLHRVYSENGKLGDLMPMKGHKIYWYHQRFVDTGIPGDTSDGQAAFYNSFINRNATSGFRLSYNPNTRNYIAPDETYASTNSTFGQGNLTGFLSKFRDKLMTNVTPALPAVGYEFFVKMGIDQTIPDAFLSALAVNDGYKQFITYDRTVWTCFDCRNPKVVPLGANTAEKKYFPTLSQCVPGVDSTTLGKLMEDIKTHMYAKPTGESELLKRMEGLVNHSKALFDTEPVNPAPPVAPHQAGGLLGPGAVDPAHAHG